MTGDMPAPTVPDEAVEAAARELAHAAHSRAFDADRMGAPTYEQVRTAYRDESRAALTAAAPFIVAANQPDAAEVERLRAQREAALALARHLLMGSPTGSDAGVHAGHILRALGDV